VRDRVNLELMRIGLEQRVCECRVCVTREGSAMILLCLGAIYAVHMQCNRKDWLGLADPESMMRDLPAGLEAGRGWLRWG
jgi:hypothetical protein